MSHMANDTMHAFGSGIQNLSADEIEEVDGGWLLAVVVVAAVVGGAYYLGRSQGDC